MMKRLKTLLSVLLPLVGCIEGLAQFNPPNPEEPSIQYKIELEAVPADVAWVSGYGAFQDGSEVWIYTEPSNGNYQFQYWEHNGEVYSRSNSFLYTVCTRDTKFVAHYKYEPYNPEEPNAVFVRRIRFMSEPAQVASFNYASGEKFRVNDTYWIFETGRRQGYVFQGWYDGDVLVSEDVDFGFLVPDRDVTLVARYVFSPDSPDDPSSFYSTSCDFVVESSDLSKGLVSAEGIEKGRAQFGSVVNLSATPLDDNTFCGWFLGDSLLSASPQYGMVVPSSSSRLRIEARFLYRPHTLTFMLDGSVYGYAYLETGSPVIPVPDVTRDGYSFSGWQDMPSVMPDNDVVVYGTLSLSSIRLSDVSVILNGGDRRKMKVQVGAESTDELTDIIWSIDNADIATVSEDGVVKGMKKGVATLTAKYRADESVMASATVAVSSDNVFFDIPSRSFEFNFNSANFNSETNSIANDFDASLSGGSLQFSRGNPTPVDGNRLSIDEICMGFIDIWESGSVASGSYFERSAYDSLTIVCKVTPRSDNSFNKSDLISNSSSTRTNYALRIGYRNSIYLATRESYSQRFLLYPDTAGLVFAVRACSGKVVLQNLSTGETRVLDSNNWGGSGGSMKFFYSDSENYFTGDFYWMYLSNAYLSDDEIWDVVDFNERTDKNVVPDVLAGDANNNGAVNVTDISTVADYVFGNCPPVFLYKAADVNRSRSINVADIAGIVQRIYDNPDMRLSTAGREKGDVTCAVWFDCDSIVPEQESVITVCVSYGSDVSAMEMDLSLPCGLTVTGAEFSGKDSGERCFRSGYVEGRYKLMTYSQSNEPLEGNCFRIRVRTDADFTGPLSVSMTDIVFSADGDEIHVPSVSGGLTMGTVPTEVQSVLTDRRDVRVYDLLGREISRDLMTGGIYIIREYDGNRVSRTYKVIL